VRKKVTYDSIPARSFLRYYLPDLVCHKGRASRGSAEEIMIVEIFVSEHNP